MQQQLQHLLQQPLERRNQRLPAVALVLQRRLRQRLLQQPPGPEIVLPALEADTDPILSGQ
jgi:hypothetical protein